MVAVIFPIVIALVMTLEIVAEYRGPRKMVYVLKPMTTVLILALAALAGQADRTYQTLILIGLACSLSGDVCLMLPEQPRSYFIPGLVSFLIAHLFYIGAFSMGVPWTTTGWLILAPFVVFGLAVGARLWSHLGPMKGPVAAYIVVILAMGWRAGARIEAPDVGTADAVVALVGAVLFIVSDLILALNRFVRPFASARATNLTTYFAAQTCIALSLHL